MSRNFITALSRISPRLGGAIAYFLFTHPAPTMLRSPAEKRLAARAVQKLASARQKSLMVGSDRIATYRFTRTGGPHRGTVLLVHGWTSAAAFMTAPIDRLNALGFDVVAFDLPAHGKSSGHRADLALCAQALAACADDVGPLAAVIAHSFGGAVTSYVVAQRLTAAISDTTRLVFIASPDRLASVAVGFGRMIGLDDRAQRDYERRLVRNIGGDIAALQASVMLVHSGSAMSVIHCRDDKEVPFEATEEFARIGPQVSVTALEGLGHRRVLYAPDALEAVYAAVV